MVVAARDIPARKPIEPDDLVVREVPLDATNGKGVVSTPDELIGRVLAVTVLQDQLVTTNLIASTAGGGGFSILGPGETVAPDSEAWRAVSITMADPSAVGGLLQAGETIDVFATATVNVPQELLAEGRYYTDRSTKLTYQNVVILARSGTLYVIRASIAVAEELAHLSAAGNVTFSAALRPEQDVRIVDASRLGSHDEPDHHEVRPPDPGDLSGPRRRRRDPPAARAEPLALHVADALTSARRPGVSATPHRLRAADPARLPGRPARLRGPGGRLTLSWSGAVPPGRDRQRRRIRRRDEGAGRLAGIRSCR